MRYRCVVDWLRLVVIHQNGVMHSTTPRHIRDLLVVDLEACLKPNPDRPRWIWWALVILKSYGLPRVRVQLCYRFGQLMLAYRLTPLAWLLQRHALKVGGAEIDPRATIGPGLNIWHTSGLVIGGDATIGRNCIIMQGVTIGIGSAHGDQGMARIGDDVFIGSGAIILGPVRIGDGARIGANATVTRDVPAGGVAVGPRAASPASGGVVELRG